MSGVEDEAVLPPRRNDRTSMGFKSSGVARAEAVAAHLTLRNRACIFFGIFLVAFAYSLDSVLRNTYQTHATSGFHEHALLSTVNVVKGVISVAAQPGAAKLADIFGRNELLIISVFFYIIGTLIVATCNSISTFAAGELLWQVGYTFAALLLQIIIADTTSLRSRVFFSYIPPFSYLIIPWVSPDIASLVLANTTWRWGIGMWSIIYTVCALPLILANAWLNHKAQKAGSLKGLKTPYQQYGGWALTKVLFWQLDAIGIVLVTSILGCTLTPLTLAGGELSQAHWGEAGIITPIIVGALCIPVFIWWEFKAPYPMIPFHLIKDRAVWGALGIALNSNFAWACQADYLYSVLIIAFNESIKSANRILSLYTFVSVVTGILAGVVIYKLRRLKPIVMLGTFVFLAAFGLLIRYRGGVTDHSHAGIIAAQVLLGIGGGLFPYPTLASIQAATKHEHIAIVTGLYLALYNLGAALGNAASGAIWTQVLPPMLESHLGNHTLADEWYASPFHLLDTYPVGTPERNAIMEAFKHVQEIICITGAGVSVALVFFSCVIRNPRLPETQSIEDAEGNDVEMAGIIDAHEVDDTESKRYSAFWK